MNATEQQIDISTADDLVPFPSVALKLFEEGQKPVPNTSHMIELIECDPTITVKVLSAANSPLYGCSREINSIPRAVLVLGAKAVSTLVLSLQAKESFASGKSKILGDYLLEHSLGTAVTSRLIAERQGNCDASAAFLTGVLHDIGKLVFLQHAAESYEQNFANISQDSVAAEGNMFGVSHVELGHRFISRMGLPAEIAIAVSDHHQPQPTTKDLGGIVSIANQLSALWEIGADSLSALDLSPESKKQQGELEFEYSQFSNLEESVAASFESLRCVFKD